MYLNCFFPGCKVMPFGSIVTGLGITSSDVDVYVFIPEGYNQDQARNVMEARKVLRRRPMVYHQPFAITTAKVPIVKFYHIPTRRNCDVSFKSPSGVRNSQLIAHLLHTDRRALPLTILIKYWSKVHKLTGTNLLPNYALTMLTIFYLQQKNILPPIIRLQSPNNSFYVDDWNTAFNEKYIHKTENDQSMYELLGEFFEFYSSFNFEENIISPFMGSPVHKKLFNNMEDIPKGFELYKKNVGNKTHIRLKTDTIMCVQDPFEHNRNCTAAVFPRLAQSFTLHVQVAAKIYKQNKSTDFLRDILMKKPNLPQASKKKRKNNQRMLSNNTNKPKNKDINDKQTNAEPKEGASNDKGDLPNNAAVAVMENTTATTNTQESSNVSEVNRPKKRTLHNNLTDLYRQTKKRKI